MNTTRKDLLARAKHLGIVGRHKMNKSALKQRIDTFIAHAAEEEAGNGLHSEANEVLLESNMQDHIETINTSNTEEKEEATMAPTSKGKGKVKPTCGKCGEKHDTVDEVRACYGAKVKATKAKAPTFPAANRYDDTTTVNVTCWAGKCDTESGDITKKDAAGWRCAEHKGTKPTTKRLNKSHLVNDYLDTVTEDEDPATAAVKANS